MPINPQIVSAQLPGIQVENPMTFARNALAMKQAQSEIEANQLAAQEAGRFNALIAASQKPDGAPITRDLLIRQGLYKRAKEFQEAENALATGEKTKLDVIGSAMDTSSRLLDTVRTPQEMMAWHEANHADPVLGPYLAARGITAEQSRAKIAAASQDPAAFQQLLLDSRLGLEKSRKQHFIEQEYGGGTRVLGMGEYGGPARVVEESDIAVTPSPNRPQTTVISKGDSAEEIKKAESRVKEYDTIRDRAVQGRRTLPSLQRAASALEKFETGFGSEAATEARRVLVSFGLADAEAAQKVQSADAFAVAVKDRILFKLSQQAGTQTEGDAQRAEDTWASYRKLTDSNKFLIDLEKAVIAQDNEQLKFYDDWEAKNGTYRGAAQAWRDGPGSKSLFDRPEMKKYADRESAAQSAANPIRVKTVEEAENLPPGTVFITPNGKRKVR